MAVASGVRITWTQIPTHVRAGIEAIIGGGAVVTAVSQSGGFSPGTADRVVTADGHRAFVKAVSTIHNDQTPEHAPSRGSRSRSTPIQFLRAGAAWHRTTTVRGSRWCLKT